MAIESVRVGLIGAGRNTRDRHIPGFNDTPGVEIGAVANRSRESGQRVADAFNIPTVYDSWGRTAGGREPGRGLHRHLALYAPAR